MGYPYEGYYPTMRECERHVADLRDMYYTLFEEAKERLQAEKACEAEKSLISLAVMLSHRE